MRRFLTNILVLSIPFIVYLAVVVLVDPYNYLNFSKIVDEAYKEKISQNVEQHLYRILRYENNPKKNISLGDSRANSLDHALDHNNWANLSFGGASLKESIQTFWWTASNFELDSVLFAVNFNNYNKYNKRFWVEEIIKIKGNFFSYAFSKYTFRSVALVLKDIHTKDNVQVNKTTLSKEDFWQTTIKTLPRKYFEKYSYPKNYYDDMSMISEYCSEKNIKLILWIPPTVVDFQAEVDKYNLKHFEETFISDMRSIGEVYDFNYYNEITKNRDCFRDPLHITNSTAIIIKEEIFGEKPEIARCYKTHL